ncbi:uncharacterized protein LOC121918446 [Sceloporus undulatus]|uniref:uncharacterized protein LOC121918446 n=1 Tax=Sceloporus undulatus TaxID=8520 RepID=UPI001C4B0A08|nr:uncharacterized protein LOC121918446 [Sceloporus undulatus]
MGTPSRGVPSDIPPARPAADRHVRLPDKCQTAQVRVTLPDRRGRGGGRPQPRVARRTGLRLPTSASAAQAVGQDQETKDQGDSGGASVAKTPLVLRDPDYDISQLGPTTAPRPPESGSDPPPRPSVAEPSRLEAERLMLRWCGYSTEVIESILAARRPSTNRIYEATFRSFKRWCKLKRVNFLDFSIPTLLQFLQDGIKKGLRPNTIRRQVAAITSVLPHKKASVMSSHPHVKRLLRGLSNRAPPTRHRFPTWNLHTVLKALTVEPFEPIRKVSLRFLTLKVIFLTAITSARRVSELGALSVRKDLCIFRPDSVCLRPDPTFLPKVNSPFHVSQDILLPSFCPNPQRDLEKCWHTLDVRRAL